MPSVRLLSITPNYMELLKAACSKPYGNDVSEKGIKAIIESGHLSVLEHCYASFEVKCSVRVLGQLTRHRHLSFTVKSARGSKFDKLVVPNGIREAFEKEAEKLNIDNKAAPRIIDNASTILQISLLSVYNEVIEQGVPEQDAAYLLPQGVETEMVVTGNFRAWFEYLPKRLCKRAMPEHRKLAARILEELQIAAPEIFKRNFLNCANCKERTCDFK